MDVKHHNQLRIGENPFYKPTNSEYGEPWLSTQGQRPEEVQDMPSYAELVSLVFGAHFEGVVLLVT